MEHYDMIARWALTRGLNLSGTRTDKLVRYATLLHDSNRKMNLTAFKTIAEIISNLIIGSLDPLLRMRVPRGTRFVDVGTGSGIPGIPFSIFFEDVSGMLIDSNAKKMEFLDLVIKSVGIPSLALLNARVEETASSAPYRESFDLALSRAFAPPYVAAELALPLVRTGGSLFLYSTINGEDLADPVRQHISELGGSVIHTDAYESFGIASPCIFIEKTGATPLRYPRRYPAIRRDAERFSEKNL